MPRSNNPRIDVAPRTAEDEARTRIVEKEISREAAELREAIRGRRAETFAAAKALEAELKPVIRGEVRFDEGSRALYSTDSSNYRQVAIGVVIPRDAEDVVQAIACCRKYRAPVVMRGGGTSLAGQTCNAAVVIDVSKYMREILEIDPDRKIARVQPGVVLDQLREEAEQHHLTFGPDPATHNHNCLGGMIGNNSCGIHSVMAGCTVHNVEELEILTYDGLRMRVGKTSDEELEQIISEGGHRGEIYAGLKTIRDKYADLIRERYPQIPRRVSGYNLDWLLPENGFDVAKAVVGTEGTCVVVLEATCRLVHSPPARSLVVLGYPDVFSAGDHVPEIMAHGPTGLEGIDDRLVADIKRKHLHEKYLRLLPEGGGWLLVEFGGATVEEADRKANRLMRDLKKSKNPPSMRLYDDPAEKRAVWKVRESGLGATANVPGQPLTWPGWEDSSVPPEKVGDYLRDLRKLLDDYGYGCDLYGHFGQGCIHTRIDFDLFTEKGIEHYRRFVEDAAEIVVRHGGSLSGEHGDGQSRGELLPKMFGEELVEAFREFKTIWDPEWRMNPGKVVNPYRIDQNLRIGPDYNPPQYETYFHYPQDEGSFSRATLRCVGVGECRRLHEGTMCPSFMVTQEEMHSTRGRARLLFELLEGDPLKKRWKDDHVWEALDLCLACKGCKGDCPVNVDMATYKAEFLSRYYEGRLRPLNMYAFGLIFRWARAADYIPGLANFLTHAPIIGSIFKGILGVAKEREIPQFAPQTFKKWFRKRPVRNAGRPRVILWPDTFNNYFFPETAKAGADVLEAAGFQVIVPQEALCCGRPLYDYGLLEQAVKQLRQVLDALHPYIAQSIPVVGLEPSCIATFRDELPSLFPTDEDAKRLSESSYMLSEFLEQHAKDFELPQMARRAVVHGHCHHKSVLKFGDEEEVIKRLGLDPDFLDSGCCGMAGAFGYTKDHYKVSIDCGDRVLLPAVRNADMDAVIMADGFSCREQIAQTTDRQALHLAEVIQMGMRDGGGLPVGERPESARVEERKARLKKMHRRTTAILGAGALLAAGALAWGLTRRTK